MKKQNSGLYISILTVVLSLCLPGSFSCRGAPFPVDDPDEFERGQMTGVWHLEDYMKNADSLSSIAGVYWSARDLDPSPIGNHHFITIVWQSLDQADAFDKRYKVGYNSFKNQAGLTVHYTTIGVITDDNTMSGDIKLEFNQSSDVQAVKEEVNPAEYIFWWKPDYDYEAHLIPFGVSTRGYSRLAVFMLDVVLGAQNFNRNYEAGIRVPYSLINENCACLVNSQFNALGFPLDVRLALGEFTGVDWGEEDLISETYFDSDYTHE